MSENETVEPKKEEKDEPPTKTSTSVSKETSNSKQKEIKEKEQELSTRDAYFASLHMWVKNANISQNAMAFFPWYLMNSYPQVFQNQAGYGMPNETLLDNQPNINQSANGNVANDAQPVIPPAIGRRVPFLDDQAQAELITRNGGFEYIIAPFWKRALAESIDFLILLLVKIMISFVFMNVFDFDIGFDVDKSVLSKSIEDDDLADLIFKSMNFFFSSSDLLLLEVATKAIICFYEAACTTFCGGATPGKVLMGLRIQYAEAVVMINQPIAPPVQLQLGVPLQRVPIKALIYPGTIPSFKRSFLRAVLKNVIITLLFPVCVFMVFFKNNRTIYDLVSKTIVVEANPNPPMRHQP